MKTFSSLQQNTNENKPVAIALGYFDGVHIGHRAVIKKAVLQKQKGFTPAVFTFDLETEFTKRSGGCLYPVKQRLNQLETLGAEMVLCPDFSDFAGMQPKEFVQCLAQNFQVKYIACGDDFTFGKNKSGNVALLKELAKEFAIAVEVVPPVTLNGERVSSTKIKEYLQEGKVEKANEMLGSPYCMWAEVVKGRQLGRTVDRPTINQHYQNGQFITKFGAYASVAKVDNKTYFSASNIGVRPTVGGSFPVCETHMLEFNRELYGETVSVYFFEFMRAEQKFNSLEEIKENVTDIANHSRDMNFSVE